METTTQELSLGKAIAKDLVQSVAITATSWAVLLGAGYAYAKFLERKAKIEAAK